MDNVTLAVFAFVLTADLIAGFPGASASDTFSSYKTTDHPVSTANTVSKGVISDTAIASTSVIAANYFLMIIFLPWIVFFSCAGTI